MWAATVSASRFRETALNLLDAAPPMTGGGGEVTEDELGVVVCAATNLALALELYLKAAHIKARTNFTKKTHSLDELFLALPVEVQTQIGAKFDELLAAVPAEKVQFIDLARGPATPPNWNPTVALETGLLPMLKRSRDAFQSWRYVFELEVSPTPKHEIIRLEHTSLNVACEAVARYLQPGPAASNSPS